ncbi:MAG: phage tail protein [Rhodospirillales bacterium]
MVGEDDPRGLRLAPVAGHPDAVSDTRLSAYIPPARLARVCGTCQWLLVTSAPPGSRLLSLGTCDDAWRLLRTDACAPHDLVHALAISVAQHRLAVSDRGAGLVRVWDAGGRRDAGAVSLAGPGALAFSPQGGIVVAVSGEQRLRRYDRGGEALPPLPMDLPVEGTVDRIAFDQTGRLWLAMRLADGRLRLWTAEPAQLRFEPARLDAVAAAFPPTGIVAVGNDGFCLQLAADRGRERRLCANWYGRPIQETDVGVPSTRLLHTQGQLLTAVLDSGIPRCTWHRVRVDADLPAGTGLVVSVSSSDQPMPALQGRPESPWEQFEAGVPHPDDWQTAANAPDFLVDQPGGRYLFLRLRLTGDGFVTPVVRRIRLDFPRVSSAQHLPAVYREDAVAGDFTERFLSLFDAVIEDVDSAIERFPALLDAEGVPDQVLPWIGRFLGIAFDSAWDARRRRAILAAAPELYRRRGTIDGLARAIRAVFDAEPSIDELARRRAWGALAERGTAARRPTDARLGEVRLFARARARLRVGQSRLGSAPLRSFGNPDLDPDRANAFRVVVTMPPLLGVSPTQLRAVIDSQKPAHVLAEVRVGGAGFVVGPLGLVGIDTVLAAPPPPVLGQVSSRLNRSAILRGGASRTGPPFRLDVASTVGNHSIVG